MIDMERQLAPADGQVIAPQVPRLGQIGLGQWGANLFRNLCEMEVLAMAYDTDAATAAGRMKDQSGPVLVRSYDHMLADASVNAVVISTPAALHYEHARKALLAGKDVFVEKPLALSLAQGEELVRLARERQRVLMVGHILHYHPAVRKLKEIITAGELGRIEYVYSNRLNIGRLRTEENILWSFAPHDISVIMALLGEEPAEVTAFGGDYLNRGIYDTTMTTLAFKNGVKAHIFVSWLHPYKEQKLIVVGSRQMAVFDDVSREKLFLYPHTIAWKDGRVPVARKADFTVVPLAGGEPLKEELEHFIRCVRTRRQPLTDGNEGLGVLRVLTEAEKSLCLSSGRLVATAPRTPKEEPDYFVHETAVVDGDVRVGAGTKIWHFSHVLGGSRIGDKCVIGQNASIGPDVTIGDRCKLQNNVSVYKGVTLEDEVFCGPSCVFTNVYNPRAFIERKHEFRPTLVKRGATIGANATVICGRPSGGTPSWRAARW
jgi:UDP-2-acetamido-3-amino-2,3-dideoxy-glucuronate N-acetyltransferase